MIVGLTYIFKKFHFPLTVQTYMSHYACVFTILQQHLALDRQQTVPNPL